MRLSVGDVIKHEKFVDVALLITKVREDFGKIIIRAMWLNQGQSKSWFLPVPTQEISIDLNDLHLWSKCKNNKPKCVRHEEWEPVCGVKQWKILDQNSR